MNRASLNSKNIVDSVGNFDDTSFIISSNIGEW
jgi:hypothetical protein